MATREQLRILIVDDQESMRQLLAASLRGLGVQNIFYAEDGVKALAILRGRPIDLVLLDSEMPRMTGLETLETLRNEEALRATRVIMVTGRADAAFVKQAAKLGVEGYLVKPVSTTALAARIDTVARAP